MSWSETLITGPASEPVSLATAKSHVRVDHTADDAYITSLITTARQWLEGRLGLAILSQQWDFWRSGWPTNPSDRLFLPRSTVISIDVFEVIDYTEAVNSIAATVWKVDTVGNPGCIALKYGQIWPALVLSTLNPIHLRYTAGTWASVSAVPLTIAQAILLLVGHWYEHREAVTMGAMATTQDLALAVDDLTRAWRSNWFGL